MLRERIPAWHEILGVLGVVVFAVHSWSVYGFLFNLPAFILKYRPGEILAVFFYHMVFAFFESFCIGLVLVVLSAILPSAWMRKGFVHKGFLLVLAAAIGAVALQNSFSYAIFEFDASNMHLLYERLGVGVLLFAGIWALTHYVAGLQKLLVRLVEQISIMLYIYLPLDVIGLLVVGWRLLR